MVADPLTQTNFHAMGSPGRLVIHGGSAKLAGEALAKIQQREAQWSRFLPLSELTRINTSNRFEGNISSDLYEALKLAKRLWIATNGLFDPSILRALLTAGYTQSFEKVSTQTTVASVLPCAIKRGGLSFEPTESQMPQAKHSFADLRFSDDCAIEVPAGMSIDLGGLGKGLTSDWICDWLINAGALGCCLSLGGDVKCAGYGPNDGNWTIGVEHPFDAANHFQTLHGTDLAVVASTSLVRQWKHNGAPMHHLIDPATQQPSASDVVAVTAIGGNAGWTEGIAKAALLSGRHRCIETLETGGVSGWAFLNDGSVLQTEIQ
jgi:FAD:protein FMN transferase